MNIFYGGPMDGQSDQNDLEGEVHVVSGEVAVEPCFDYPLGKKPLIGRYVLKEDPDPEIAECVWADGELEPRRIYEWAGYIED